MNTVVDASAHPSRNLRELYKPLTFPDYPASWYVLCAADALARGPTSRRLLGTELVAYRTDSRRVAVMAARCAHLGADLGRGRVVGDCIECPFHGWRYGPDGRCRRIPSETCIPRRASLPVYPAVERHGLVFVFNGTEPSFPLPFFAGERARDFVPAAPFEFTTDCSWYMAGAHAFDVQHFEGVHSRSLQEPVAVDCPSPYARRSRYRADVRGDGFYDRLLRRCVGAQADTTITTWGGTLVFVTARFERATSRFMIALEPTEDGRTRCRVVAYVRRPSNLFGRLRRPIESRLRRHFTAAYLLSELDKLGSPRYSATNLVAADAELVRYFAWAAALPSSRSRALDAGPPTSRVTHEGFEQ